jgi:hypothetical protein
VFENQIHSGDVDSAPQREDEKATPQGASAESSTDLPF